MPDTSGGHGSRQHDLSGKVAIVTGGSRGIGLASAMALAAEGAKVVLVSRKPDDLAAAAERVTRETGGEALAVPAHTGDDEAGGRVVARAVAEYGGVDILVNNAATNPHFGPLLSSQDSHWDKTWEVNVKGYFNMARACVMPMSNRGGGRIINVASVAGLRVQPGMGVYCISKAAVIMLTKVLAVELADNGITVNALAPGFVKTKLSSAIWSDEKLSHAVTRAIPQRRMALPREIAELALFLASAESSFVTGSILTIDGGQLAGSGIAL